MIQRFNNISNIGNFYDYINDETCLFDKFTLIYGQNAYGKSTIADIFDSLSTNNSTLISSRKSVGSTGYPYVSILLSDRIGNINALTFEKTIWKGFKRDYDIEVFNNRYIQRNVLKGIELTRDNKINITQYILGEENIIQAEEISDLKRKRGEVNKKLATLRNNIEKIIPNDVTVEDFIELVIEEDHKAKLDMCRRKQEHIEETIKNTKNILEINPVNEINIDTDFQQHFLKINTLLQTTYEDINDIAYKRIVTHIQNTFSKVDSSVEGWIKQGTENYLKEGQGKCPYCGQEIFALELIQAYKKYFSEAYQEYCTQIIDDLRGHYKLIRDKLKALENEDVKKILLNLANICLIIQDKEFTQQVQKLEVLANEYETQLKEFISVLSSLMVQIEEKARYKKGKPYEV